MKWGSSFGKTVWQLLSQLEMELPYDTAVSLLGTDPRELNACISTKMWTWMFIVALCIVAEKWKQPSVLQLMGRYIKCGTTVQRNLV